ncbi:coiled-coil domain-containing protein 116 [Peromyscus eremicus]|uniref:coiled-coil domain-containing protein 116 n=1 Tax=Peromyscus eremicus TaxID=42410 RepID=UPI0027DB58BB|nr:coiled-coil domain-containing protein 116 [Peromyscus eremicus]XP_059132802.1 coiled-coil domain-containing protein 116 [Peromyscus eremicus]XP_059132803.1 coiled-coil domain-containing protein 116 [Peromyscus eremicus]XP_059132804.1 coiled-coil domain-containing protein 116 [Peromyscus eremicus]
MARYRHHSGYLADDEAGHNMAWMQLHKKHLLPERGSTCRLGRVPHLPSMNRYSEHQGHQQKPRRPQGFGTFLDFLTEGQVLESLQTVVEQATERLAATKTEAGVPLVDVQDPLEVPSGRQRARTRPSINSVHRHRARPTLCAGCPNNYPSCSSSVSDCHSSITAGGLGSHSQDSDPGARGIGSLPPMRDKLLLEKNLKRLLRLENKGKGLNQSCSRRDSPLWDSLGSQTCSSQWTREQPLSWVTRLWGSSSTTPETSELGLGEQEMIFLKEELNKGMKSLLNQPASFNVPAYCSLREPHCTLDFLAEHRLFPALQRVVSQAVHKLSHACRHDGFPLFSVASEPNSMLPGNSDLLQPDSKASVPTSREDGVEPCDSPTTASSLKTARKKSKGRRESPSMSNAQMTTRFRLKSPGTKFPRRKPLPSTSSVSSLSYVSDPWFEELTSFLVEQAVSLLLCKYKFEESLTKQLGFISFPVTELLMDIFLGFKKVKGTHIRLSSDINWTCLLRKLEEAELARQATRHASRPAASHPSTSRVGTSRHSSESPSVQPKLAGAATQDQSAGSRFFLRPELPIRQLLSPRDPGTGQEQMPRSPSEPKLSVFSTGMGSRSSQSKEIVNTEEGEDSEEEEEDGGSEEDDLKNSSEDEQPEVSLPEPEVEDFINESIVKSPSDSP